MTRDTKVLVCGGWSLDGIYQSIWNAFVDAGCAVRYFSTRMAGHETATEPRPNIMDRIAPVIEESQPDILFWCLCKNDCPVEFPAELKKRFPKLVTVFHSYDDPFALDAENAQEQNERIAGFDLAVTCCEGSVKTYQELGTPAICLYPPPDRMVHGKAKVTGKFSRNFAFAGTNTYPKVFYPHVFENRADVVRMGAQFGTMRLYGTWNTNRFDWGSPYGAPELEEEYQGFLPYDQLAQVYADTRINLNTHIRPDGYKYLNMRAINVMASGGFLLTDHVEGIEELFTPGFELATWQTLADLRQLIKFWLAHPDERAEVAARGRRKVWELYSGECFAKAVLKHCSLGGVEL